MLAARGLSQILSGINRRVEATPTCDNPNPLSAVGSVKGLATLQARNPQALRALEDTMSDSG
jgi:hypothetical protein